MSDPETNFFKARLRLHGSHYKEGSKDSGSTVALTLDPQERLRIRSAHFVYPKLTSNEKQGQTVNRSKVIDYKEKSNPGKQMVVM